MCKRCLVLWCSLMSLAGNAGAEDAKPKGAKVAKFRAHAVNADAEYSAAAAFDVNKDGKLDIFCGGSWYEAPTWKRHFVRQVEQIRGRYDGYSHLPMDVNGDGWMDVVNVNYRSRSLYWIQHPGKSLGAWTKRMIAEPGPMETGRLVDVDGDGIIDVLPNGVKFAAWWELRAISEEPVWARHDLPIEVAGHGVGIGDIDGDGRKDIVGPRGWARQPLHPRKQRWIWRPEFRLHRDCGLPILVHDVDGDGDNDLIWSRGHNFGLYWLEQRKGEPKWRQHVIDTSWSQAHSLLLEDIDNDGRKELIAGKRYMGHDGKDPGEYDPLRAYYYDFDRKLNTFRRIDITYGKRVGYGLDPKAIDLDNDGDLDLLASGRSGLYWIENLLVGGTDVKQATTAVKRPRPSPQKLLHYIDEQGGRRVVKNKSDWALRRDQILEGMTLAMGPPPTPLSRAPLEVKIESREETEKYVRQRISFAAEKGDRVPAYLLVPKNITAPGPAMLCLHQTTRIGKGEPAGLGGKPNLHYGHELANRGVVCLIPDYPSFGDYPFDFKKQAPHYASGSMKAIWNNHRAVDLLESLPEVHPDKIGVIGHSLGGHNALFTAAWDQRLKVAVTSCGFTAFHHYYGGKLKGWTSDRYMPRINDRYGNDPDRAPFDFHEVLAAIAPRMVLINAPQRDGNFEVNGVKKVVAEVKQVYELLGAPSGSLHAVYPDAGHDFPTEVRTDFYARILRALK